MTSDMEEQAGTSPQDNAAVGAVAVIGGGTMGSGIAQVLATAGVPVTVVDRTDADLERARQRVRNGLDRLVRREAMTDEQAVEALERIDWSDEIASVAGVDFVIEAVFEDVAAKQDVISRVSALAGPGCVIASNTSSISVTALAASAKEPENVVGMHFFNPVPAMRLVEIIKGLQTSDAAANRAIQLARFAGKEPVVMNDSPGFVANRLLLPMINEAILCFSEGVAGKEEIDTVMRLGASHPMGPLALADMIGLDICLSILDVLHREFGDDKYRAAPLLRRMVAAGHLGRKTGQGFYSYS